ncbi:MAG: hypothetical protein ABS62_12070 [Microbacterium sp. SCN 70-200]|uniref:PAS domain-containing sensor histidine kinase n=1 Tax=unclassified Microbacterium TaxID=2609290 RepID=UPI00086AF521|nr:MULTISPECIES: PAS domain-containing sensor histidine kinase [unclassified Microbacterium]MBN9216095.1 sensor histidine kinase [Microbacterium sp.]ODT39834.1 MAG: hypothetical protein ABS62_12070 [Microbacterium sp. SCN 70-200]OJV80573.1 MAG: hypothetical protein BGO46_01330 [Microbacterium sp. 70-16]
MNTSASRWADNALIGTLTRSVWQWQLILTFCVVIMGMIAALFNISLFGDGRFLTGLIVIVTVGALSITVHWARLSRRAVLAVPLADIVAIGLLAAALQPFAFLWVLPIAWVATYYGTFTLLTTLGVVLISQAPGWITAGRDGEASLTVLIVLLALGFLGATISIGTSRTRAFRHLLQRQSRQLDRALQRVQAQERSSSRLFDTIGLALARINEEGHIVASNAAFRRLYALVDGDARHPTRSVEYDGHRGNALPPDQTSLALAARGERVQGERVWLYDADGEWHALSLSIYDRAGDDPRGALLEFEDDSAVVASEAAARSAASAISHELRNPLTAILGHVDLLVEEGELTQSQREHALVIESAAERMLTLIRRLLDTRPAEPTEQAFDLGELARNSVAAFTPSAAARTLTITTDIAPDLLVTGTAFRMRQVIDNVLSNAIKYTPRGGSVTVTGRRDDATVTLVVADSGIGMAPADVERVFDPYFRADTAIDSGATGTGLGMGISREIVQQHHGEITLRSALASGTTVTITLPVDGKDGSSTQNMPSAEELAP